MIYLFILPLKIKLERALGKPTTFTAEPILIWVYHHPTDGLGLKNQGI